MVDTITQYRPIKEDVWGKIKTSWDFYRDQIGLEGNIMLDLVKEEKSMNEIEEVIELHRIERNDNIKAYHDLLDKK